MARINFMQPKLRLKKRDLERIDRQLEGVDPFGPFEYFSPKQRDEEEHIKEVLRRKFPVRIGSVSDPFQERLERENRHTEKILKWLGKFNYPYLLCTKSKLVSDPHYLKLIKETRGAVQVSLISLNKELLGRLEPNPASADERLDSMSKLVNNGIWTACRIQPLIPAVTEQDTPELIDKLAKIGINHITIEFMKFPQTHVNYMNENLRTILKNYHDDGGVLPKKLVDLDFSLKDYYRSFQDYTFREQYLFFSKSGKDQLMRKSADLVKEANSKYGSNMTFASGDEEPTYLNFTRNCCGIDLIWGERGYSTCTVQKMLQIAKEKGCVTLKEMRGFYNPFPEKFRELWNLQEKGGYFFEKRILNLAAKTDPQSGEVYYEYREGLA